jgi:hypothetical protein
MQIEQQSALPEIHDIINLTNDLPVLAEHCHKNHKLLLA